MKERGAASSRQRCVAFEVSRLAMSASLLVAFAFGDASAQAPGQAAWNGFYLGAGAGIGAMKLRQTADLTPLFGYVATIDNAGDGVFGALQAGYDFSLNRWLVLGAFADLDFGNVRSVPLVDVADPSLNDTIDLRRAWSVGGRFGVVPQSRTLWYVPFGYTGASVREHNISINADQETVDKTLHGWFAGVGAETFVATHWSVKLEYRYAQLGNGIFYTDRGGNRFYIDAHEHSVRAVASYRFGAAPTLPGPPVFKAEPARPAQSWTGPYAGVGIGAAAVKYKERVEYPGIPDTAFADLGGEGAFATVQAGFDVQFAPGLVAGVFGDYDLGNIKSVPATISTLSQFNDEIRIRRSWDVGARIGVSAWPGALLYLPAGFTRATVSETNLTQLNQERVARTLDGWFVGLGAETTLCGHWGLKLEYRYTALKDAFFAADGLGDRFSLEPREHSARLVVDYRFAPDLRTPSVLR
jgi:outer membrane immunogenic protein